MEDVFGTQPKVEQPQGEPVEQVIEQQHAEQAHEQPEATPPVADTETNVPLKALEAERTKRREYRDKFHQAEGELKALREQMQRYSQGGIPQPQADQPQQQFQDPMQRAAYEAIERAENSRFDMSEMLTREKFGDELVTKAFEHIQSVNDPAVWTRIKASKNPWAEVVKESKRLEILGEMGDDPLTYEEKLKAKWLADANPSTPAAPKAPLPASLATARSAGARSAPAFTGPTPISSMFKN